MYARNDIPPHTVLQHLVGWRRSPAIAVDQNSAVDILPGPIIQDRNIVVMDGPLYFVNSSCMPNCKWVAGSRTAKVVQIETLSAISKGDEITVNYGPEFFQVGECKCSWCNSQRNK